MLLLDCLRLINARQNSIVAFLELKMWHWIYDEFGGYDCMTASFYIKKNNKYMFDLDLSSHKFDEARDLAKLIVDLLNTHEAGLVKQANTADLKSADESLSGSIPESGTKSYTEIPYTLNEAKIVVEKHSMDIYHRDLMKWLISEIEKK